LGRWGVGFANHNLILARVSSYPQVPCLTHRFALSPTRGRIYDGRSVLLMFLPMYFKMFVTMSTLLGGWLHERGPAESNIRRNDKTC
jgi:hypothetical protein